MAHLAFGLPTDFDFSTIRTIKAAKELIGTLPNRDRGKAASGLYRASRKNRTRKKIDNAVAYAGMMEAWNHDASYTANAFPGGGDLGFARALRRVAPAHGLTEPLEVWRGVYLTDKEQLEPLELAMGISWTKDRDVAAWFAMRFNVSTIPGRAFVFRCTVQPEAIITFEDARNEAEVIVDPLFGHFLKGVTVDYDGTKLSELTETSTASEKAIADWRIAYERRGEAVTKRNAKAEE